MSRDVTGYWSKALGFGISEPVTERLVDQVAEFYRAEGTPSAVIQLAPAAIPSQWPQICRSQNIRLDSTWVKLACAIEDVRPGERTDLRIGAVEPDDFGTWASTTLRAFGMPEEGLADMLVAAVTHPGFRPFAAWDGDDIVATANLFINGESASLTSAATLPQYRNLGAQSALIAARAKEAANEGCRWLCAETGKPDAGQRNPSLNNLRRSGLQPLYDRQNWTWSAS
jgi:GNAT superfamily N-acetyltransferase